MFTQPIYMYILCTECESNRWRHPQLSSNQNHCIPTQQNASFNSKMWISYILLKYISIVIYLYINVVCRVWTQSARSTRSKCTFRWTAQRPTKCHAVDYDLNDLDFSIPYLFWDVPYIYIGDTAALKNHANAMKCSKMCCRCAASISLISMPCTESSDCIRAQIKEDKSFTYVVMVYWSNARVGL